MMPPFQQNSPLASLWENEVTAEEKKHVVSPFHPFLLTAININDSVIA